MSRLAPTRGKHCSAQRQVGARDPGHSFADFCQLFDFCQGGGGNPLLQVSRAFSLMVPLEVWKRTSRADRDRDLELREIQRDLLSLVTVMIVTQNSSAL